MRARGTCGDRAQTIGSSRAGAARGARRAGGYGRARRAGGYRHVRERQHSSLTALCLRQAMRHEAPLTFQSLNTRGRISSGLPRSTSSRLPRLRRLRAGAGQGRGGGGGASAASARAAGRPALALAGAGERQGPRVRQGMGWDPTADAVSACVSPPPRRSSHPRRHDIIQAQAQRGGGQEVACVRL
jgi:hypothetical protein